MHDFAENPNGDDPTYAEPLTFPISFGEQRLWFLDQLEPTKSAYNVPEAVRLTGQIHADALESAIQEIVRRHESLRTTFGEVNDLPMQIVAPSLDVRLVARDLRNLPAAEREPEAGRLASEEANAPFDLKRGPLIRALLIRLQDHEHILVVVMHHIVSEGGWSMGVFRRELSALYNAYSSGQPSPLAELPIQYGDYAVWQRDTLKPQVLRPHLSYWKDQLAGAPALIDWAVGRPRPAEQTYNGARQSVLLPKNLKHGLDVLARQEGVTLFMTLLAAFQVLLYRYTGQEDLVVGVPVAGRTPQTEPLIGLFLNALALRTQLSPSVSFRQFLKRVREVVVSGLTHQDLPFEWLVEATHPDRSMAFTPLFQVMFSFQPPGQALDLNGLTETPFEVESKSSAFDLTLFAWEMTDELKIRFEYSTDLFDSATISSMLDYFQVLLESMVRNPDERISTVELVTGKKRTHRLLDQNQSETGPVFVAPRDPLERSLASIWEHLLNVKPIGVRDNYFDLGGHSLLAARLFSEIRRGFGVSLPLSTLFHAPTVEQLAQVLRKDRHSAPPRSLVPIQPNGSKPPLVCVAGLDGEAVFFRRLADFLGPDQPIFGLEPPGRDGQQPLLLRLEDIASHYVRELRAAYPNGPYYLGGYSFGGLVIFEMAQQLHRQGEKVGLVALLDTWNKTYVKQLPRTQRWRQIFQLYQYHFSRLLFGPERLGYVKLKVGHRVLRTICWYCDKTGRPLPQQARKLYDVQSFAAANYVPKVYPGRLDLFRAKVKHQLEIHDGELGWGRLAQGGVAVHEVPGDHLTMNVGGNLQILAEQLKACLEQAQHRPARVSHRSAENPALVS
ncbi:MAG: alpha/beta fold hydrolase [Acidobacteriia bacterium]|nr:alpha/beta fold hydrolase [Terriglobia bacterium]